MKISEMTNDQACEALIRLSQPVANIAEDENMKPFLDEIQEAGKKPFFAAIGSLLPKFVSIAIKDHKSDMYEIVGALTFQHTTKVAKMNFVETLKTLRESIDEDFLSFFRRSGSAMRKQGTDSE